MNRMLLSVLFILALSMNSYADMLLYSDEDKKFYGCVDCSEYDSKSICNQDGPYGSTYSPESIWNPYGIGSRYNHSSPFNPYGNGLKIVDSSGSFYGYFSIGFHGHFQFQKILKKLWEQSDGDLDKMRDLFCQ